MYGAARGSGDRLGKGRSHAELRERQRSSVALEIIIITVVVE